MGAGEGSQGGRDGQHPRAGTGEDTEGAPGSVGGRGKGASILARAVTPHIPAARGPQQQGNWTCWGSPGGTWLRPPAAQEAPTS